MELNSIYKNRKLAAIQEQFFSLGYLLPALLPLMYILGRAPYNILSAIYLVWALISIWGHWPKTSTTLKLLFVVLFTSFLLGVPFAVEPIRAFRSWSLLLGSSLVFFFSLAAFQNRRDALLKFMRTLALSTLFVPVALFIKSGLVTGEWGTLIVRKSWQETSIPFLSVVLMWLIWESVAKKYRLYLCCLVLSVALAYIFASDGRSALLALLCAAGLFAYLVMKLPRRYFVVVGLAIIVASALFIDKSFFVTDVNHLNKSFSHALNLVSSHRTVLWQQAIENPPENLWIGAGISNVRYYPDVVTITTAIGTAKVKHLHNFLLDIWYETGFLGLGTFSLLMGYLLLPVRKLLREPDEVRNVAATLFVAIIAIFVAGLLSIGYTSPHFKVYIFMLFAGLVSLQATEE